MKRTILAAISSTALAFSAVPSHAQDDEPSAEEMEQIFSGLAEGIAAEPLTAEQEARLPQATRIVGMMVPEGTLAELMGSMFDEVLSPIADAAGGPAISTVVQGTGLTTLDIDLDAAQATELATLFDPAWKERREIEMRIFPQVMTEVMTAMEPAMRKAMSELYAINFNSTELSEIEAFFSTETGANFARKSFTMSSDPRVVSASMEVMPQLMGALTGMEQRMADATADLPEKRRFPDLSAEEKARIAEVTGYSIEEIEANTAGDSIDWSDDYAEDESADGVEEGN